MTSKSPFPHFATDAIHAGQEPEQWDHYQVVPPISLATTYKQHGPGEPKKFDYARAGNPTRECLETCLASLEKANYCSCFASGLAATAALSNLLKTGDHLVCCDDVYGGSQRYYRQVACNHGLSTSMVDMTDPKYVLSTIQENTKMVWIESPTNPLLKVADIRGICKAVRQVRPDILLVVDNTFMTPYYQRPLELGADASVHSITKYINGHADVCMGAVMTNNDVVGKHLKFMQLAVGAVPSAFDCYLVNRGVKTLHVRMQMHLENATRIAHYLESNKRVRKVLFPELPSHPQHQMHKAQAKGMSGMLSFYHKGGLEESRTFLKNLKLFVLAESLGGYESLAELPSLMTHASVPGKDRAVLGITDDLIRLSVGLEEPDDLIEDLEQALVKAKFDYARAGNPTRECLEKCLASLEDAKYCSCFASGVAAISAMSNLMKTGDHLVTCDDIYGGSQRYYREVACNHGLSTTMVDMTDPQNVLNALQENTKMVWIESPTNPLLKVADIDGICNVVRKSRPEITLVVDNTFMTPYYQHPLELGADASVHSITKYINGHADVVMGCVMTNSDIIGKHLKFNQLAVGAVPSAFDCYLVNRGVKTLHVRMQMHLENATKIAHYLESNKRVRKVLFPELPSHPQHQMHKAQAKGMSGMLSFYHKGGLEQSRTFLKNLKIFTLAESLGGFESLAELPSLMTHASVPLEHRKMLGITDDLIRLSIGLEDVDDLIQDLEQALIIAIAEDQF